MASKEEEKVKMEDGPSSADEDQAPDDDFAEADASASEYEEEEEDAEEYGTDEEAPEDVRSNLVFAIVSDVATKSCVFDFCISILLWPCSAMIFSWDWLDMLVNKDKPLLNSDIVSKLLVFVGLCRCLIMRKQRKWLVRRRLV